MFLIPFKNGGIRKAIKSRKYFKLYIMSSNSKQAVLDALKKEGVTNLEQFADFASGLATKGDKNGNPIVMTAIISPGFFVSH